MDSSRESDDNVPAPAAAEVADVFETVDDLEYQFNLMRIENDEGEEERRQVAANRVLHDVKRAQGIAFFVFNYMGTEITFSVRDVFTAFNMGYQGENVVSVSTVRMAITELLEHGLLKRVQADGRHATPGRPRQMYKYPDPAIRLTETVFTD